MARYFLPLLVCFELHYEEFIFINILVCFFVCVCLYLGNASTSSLWQYCQVRGIGAGGKHISHWLSACAWLVFCLIFFFDMLLFALV